MIEILFGESEGGAMKLAKNYQQPDYEDGPTAWLGEKPDKATFEDMFAGEAVGGTSAEVIILPFMLDIGSLREPLDGTYRKKIILEQYGVYWNEDEKEEREELEQAVETYERAAADGAVCKAGGIFPYLVQQQALFPVRTLPCSQCAAEI